MSANERQGLVIALDGPAGVGKSSVALRIAERFDLTCVETGAIYRAVALKARTEGIATDDEAALAALAAGLDIDFRTAGADNRVFLDGAERTAELRAPEVGRLAGQVSALPAVRAALLGLQRAWVQRAGGGILAEGRDIGTVVFPDADVKIYLTATPEERARRRHLQLTDDGEEADYDEVLAAVKARDHGDTTRAVAPLRPADDAIILDSTDMDIERVVEEISRHVIARRSGLTAAPKGHRAGFVALVGRPNTGKSTLLNHLLGEKVAIVSPKPQTTRHRILGIFTRPAFQIAFVDTPGIHEGGKELNRVMVAAALDVLGDVDVVCLLLDAIRFGKEPTAERVRVDAIVAAIRDAGTPFVLAINKIDRVKKHLLLPIMESYAEAGAAAIVPISALMGDGLDALTAAFVEALPEGDRMFPDEQITDRDDRFMITETVREKVLLYTHQEVPHSVAVSLDRMEDGPRPKRVLVITATIHVERSSQKGIIIGKRGAMLVRIGTAARLSLEERFGRRINLELHVRVEKDWTRHAKGLKRVEYTP